MDRSERPDFYTEEGREWHRQKIRDGIIKARKAGIHIGRKKVDITAEQLRDVAGLSTREAAKKLGIGASTVRRLRKGDRNQ